MSDSDEYNSDNRDKSNCSASKKSKRMCSFKPEWEKFDFLKRVDGDIHKAFCKICSRSFLISHGGLNDIKRHVNVPEHQRREKTCKSNQSFQMFLKRDVLTSEEEKVLAAELVKVYHGVKHNIAYTTIDCDSKLCPVIFGNSKICSKISLGKTEAASLVHNVLAPASTEEPIEKLKSVIFYSISTDASNHGNIKLFPLIVRFYYPTDGMRTYLLDF